MNAQRDAISSRRDMAEREVEDYISWYDGRWQRSRLLFKTFQTATIVLGGLTPLLVLWDQTPKVFQALPAALAAICAAITSMNRWQESWIRNSVTYEDLRRELFKFRIQATELYRPAVGADAALDNFAKRVDQIIGTEVSSWSAGLSTDREKSKKARE